MRIIPEFTSTNGGDLRFETTPVSNTTPPISPTQNSQCTILVIDDDVFLQRLIRQALSVGATVHQEYDSVTERVEELRFDGVDAIILDYQLPGRDGLLVLRDIREKYPDLPVLFMTGFGDLDVAKQAISLGANEYFTKPFEVADLREVVASLVPSYNKQPVDLASISLFADLNSQPLKHPNESDNFFVGKDAEGNSLEARVIRYNSRSVIVETELADTFTRGTELDETKLTLGNRSMDVVAGRVLGVTPLANKRLIEISLPGVWKIEGYKVGTDPSEISAILKASELPKLPAYSRFSQGVQERQLIPEHYRSTVTDVEHILQEFYDDLEPFEKLLLELEPGERTDVEQRMIDYAKERFFPALTTAMNQFEKAAQMAEKEGIKHHFKSFAQKRLYPLMLCSPFLSRVIEQPIGVPGDYGILGRLLGHPFEGHSLFGKMLNAWAITANPSAAYRHRISLLNGAIQEAVQKASKEGRRVRILSMASGVAYEVQHFVSDMNPTVPVDFELVDFSTKTLWEARRQFSERQKIANPENVNIRLKHGSVVDLAKQSKNRDQTHDSEKYDLVYCAGLFDYLSANLCANIISYLYGLAKDDGKVIVSNYTPKNALRYFMGVVLDWELIHRSPDEFDAIMKRTAANKDYQIVEDDTRTELYAIAHKQQTAKINSYCNFNTFK